MKWNMKITIITTFANSHNVIEHKKIKAFPIKFGGILAIAISLLLLCVSNTIFSKTVYMTLSLNVKDNKIMFLRNA